MQRHGSIFLGTILIGIGGIYLLRAIDLWPDDVSTWPGVLIVLGVAILLDQILRDTSISWFMPLFLIGLGTFFLLRDSNIVDGDILPGLATVAGDQVEAVGTDGNAVGLVGEDPHRPLAAELADNGLFLADTDQIVVAAAVGDEVGDRPDLEPVFLGEGHEVGQGAAPAGPAIYL